jgi:hypothetical protein
MRNRRRKKIAALKVADGSDALIPLRERYTRVNASSEAIDFTGAEQVMPSHT